MFNHPLSFLLLSLPLPNIKNQKQGQSITELHPHIPGTLPLQSFDILDSFSLYNHDGSGTH